MRVRLRVKDLAAVVSLWGCRYGSAVHANLVGDHGTIHAADLE